jgi:hypothetical protein
MPLDITPEKVREMRRRLTTLATDLWAECLRHSTAAKRSRGYAAAGKQTIANTASAEASEGAGGRVREAAEAVEWVLSILPNYDALDAALAPEAPDG